MKSPLEFLQPLGRALMLPIAVLPVAGLLLRLGQPDLLNIPILAASGDAITIRDRDAASAVSIAGHSAAFAPRLAVSQNTRTARRVNGRRAKRCSAC